MFTSTENALKLVKPQSFRGPLLELPPTFVVSNVFLGLPSENPGSATAAELSIPVKTIKYMHMLLLVDSLV